MVETVNKLIRVSRQLLQELGREPLPEEIAKELDMPVERVQEICRRFLRTGFARNSDRREDGHLEILFRMITCLYRRRRGADARKEQLDEVLDTLTEREQRVMRLRFGMNDGRARRWRKWEKNLTLPRERIK